MAMELVTVNPVGAGNPLITLEVNPDIPESIVHKEFIYLACGFFQKRGQWVYIRGEIGKYKIETHVIKIERKQHEFVIQYLII